MADTRTGSEVRTVDIRPNLPQSPVVAEVKTFIERLSWYAERTEDTSVKSFLNSRLPRVRKAMTEIITDDSVIMVTGKLPSDRDRYIGTKRSIL